MNSEQQLEELKKRRVILNGRFLEDLTMYIGQKTYGLGNVGADVIVPFLLDNK